MISLGFGPKCHILFYYAFLLLLYKNVGRRNSKKRSKLIECVDVDVCGCMCVDGCVWMDVFLDENLDVCVWMDVFLDVCVWMRVWMDDVLSSQSLDLTFLPHFHCSFLYFSSSILQCSSYSSARCCFSLFSVFSWLHISIFLLRLCTPGLWALVLAANFSYGLWLRTLGLGPRICAFVISQFALVSFSGHV